ncbi:competence/damage-inducible protein CinA [Leptospira interrogans serovar Bataviae str. HAI135]|nr:competence/damage-inducible protein CinA [Leptospira interrogans serovar Bataviae str. HAI135]
MISKTFTDKPGSSAYFYGGVISYDNGVKEGLLGVKKNTLKDFGAVSAETAKEMAEGALVALGVDYSISVTGIAGPGGGTPQKKWVLFILGSDKKTEKRKPTNITFLFLEVLFENLRLILEFIFYTIV